MSSREITLRIDEHWYDALTKLLKGESLEEHLEDVLDDLCNQIPQREYERISALIWRDRQAQEANCCTVTEDGARTLLIENTPIEIYWDDLRSEKQQEILNVFGDNGNYDLTPIAVIGEEQNMGYDGLKM